MRVLVFLALLMIFLIMAMNFTSAESFPDVLGMIAAAVGSFFGDFIFPVIMGEFEL